MVNVINRASFVEGATISLDDPVYNHEILTPNYIHADRDCRVKLIYGRQSHSDLNGVQASFSLSVSYQVEFMAPSGTTTETGVVNIEYNQSKPVYLSVNNYTSPAGKVRLTITDVCFRSPGSGAYDCNTALPPAIPNDIQLELELNTHYFTEMPSYMAAPFTGDATVMNITNQTQNFQIAWGYIPGAESYDLEWVFIDEHDNANFDAYENSSSISNNPFTGIKYKAPVRINTSDQYYSLENTFNSGVLFFRVRGVGKFVNQTDGNYSWQRTGPWSYATENGAFTPILTNQFEMDKTWQIQKTYAEGGKNKKIISYYDETSRQRQILTNLSSDNTILVAETKYDYEGRPVVSMLPTPVPASNSLTFKPQFNVFASANTFSKEEFDKGASSVSLASLSGAAKYYSPDMVSPVPYDVNQQYTPQSNGYVYSQITYMRDNTGRVERQSGVGELHKLYGGNDTKYYYAKANETELERLFGSNVGIAKHYEKIAVQDANGQVSVSYKDQEGRTIATALAGPSPENLEPLSYNSTANILVDLTENNNYDTEDRSYESENKILNLVDNTPYKFYYELSPILRNGSVCLYCKYDVTIQVIDPDGLPVDNLELYSTFPSAFSALAAADFTGKTHLYESEGKITDVFDPASTCTGSTGIGYTPLKNLGFSAMFVKQGVYTVRKTLQLVMPEINSTLINQWMTNNELPTIDEVYTELKNKINFSVCDVTCEDHCKSLYPSDLTARRTCITNCINNNIAQYSDSVVTDECDGLRAQMLNQLSPGGIYYDTWVNTSTSDPCYTGECIVDHGTITDQYTLFNPLHDREGDILVYDPAGSTDPDDIVDICDLKNCETFKEEWAEQLLKFHPEYCHLLLCGSEEDEDGLYKSRNFDRQMALVPEWVAAEDRYEDTRTSGADDYPHPEQYDDLFDPTTNDCKISFTNTSNVTQTCTLTRAALTTLLSTGGNVIRVADATTGIYTSMSIYDYVDADNGLGRNDLPAPVGELDNPLYNGIDENDAAAIAERKWKLFRGMYLQAKRELINEYLVGCYCNNANSIVVENPPLTDGYLVNGAGEPYEWTVVKPVPDVEETMNNVVSSATGPDGPLTWQNDEMLPKYVDECKSTCDEQANVWFERLKYLGAAPLDLTTSFGVCHTEILGALYFPGHPDYEGDIIEELASFCETKCEGVDPAHLELISPIPPVILNTDINATNFPTLFTLGLGGCLTPNENCDDRLAYWLEHMVRQCPDLIEAGHEGLYAGANDNKVEIDGATTTGLNTDLSILQHCLAVVCQNISNIFNPNVILSPSVIEELIASGNAAPRDAILIVQAVMAAHGCGSASSVIPEEFESACDVSPCLRALVQDFNSSGGDVIKDYTTNIVEIAAGSSLLNGNCNSMSAGPVVHVTTTGTTPVITVTWTQNVPIERGGVIARGPISTTVSLSDFTRFYTAKITPEGMTTTYFENGKRSTQSSSATNGNRRSSVWGVNPLPEGCDVLAFYDACGNKLNINDIATIGTPYYEPTPPYYVNSLTTDGSIYIEVAAVITLTSGYIGTVCTTATNTVTGYFYKPMTADCQFEYTNCPNSLEQWQNDCISFLYAEANYNAYKVWDSLLDIKSGEYLSSYENSCHPPLEKFIAYYPINEYHYTLYYYDQAGNLIQTVPPEGVDVLGTQDWDYDEDPSVEMASLADLVNDVEGPEDQPNHRLVTRYQYNALNQLVWQITPDAGESEFRYDRLGRLRFSQNAKQKLEDADKYSFTTFDNLGRITNVGEAVPVDLTPANIDNPDFPIGASGVTTSQVTNTQYDYAGSGGCLGTATYLRGRVSQVSTEAAVTQYSYDIHGNVKSLSQTIAGMDLDEDEEADCKRIDYEYDLLSGKVNRVNYQAGHDDMFAHRYEYDADNRLKNVYTTHDNVIWDEDAAYFYYPHGPLSRIEIGHDMVQGLDYYYTLHGWLKGVNMPGQHTGLGNDGVTGTTNPNRYFANDEYRYALGYYNGDYTPAGGTSLMGAASAAANTWGSFEPSIVHGSGTLGLYNGNITWMTNDLPQLSTLVGDQPAMQNMVYKYDQLNRITGSHNFNYTTGTTTWARRSDHSYETGYTFDKNGNITSLTRKGSNGTAMDDLTYYYNIHLNNQLAHVADGVSAGNFGTDVDDQGTLYSTISSGHLVRSGNYTYDAIGNLIQDAAEHLTAIHWNVYGKIKDIEPDGLHGKPTLEFAYDGAGNRISKIVTPEFISSDLDIERTFYVRDASGNVMATYIKGSETLPVGGTQLAKTTIEYPLYGSSRLGMYKTVTGGIQLSSTFDVEPADCLRQLNRKQYELTDHLGNVVATVTDLKIGIANTSDNFDHYQANITSLQDYYPFGSVMPGRSFNTPAYRYGYNSQEKEDEINGNGNITTAQFWEYDTRLGRRWNTDPKIEFTPGLSPYSVFNNAPIRFNDPNGDIAPAVWAAIVYLAETGAETGIDLALGVTIAYLTGMPYTGWDAAVDYATNLIPGWGEAKKIKKVEQITEAIGKIAIKVHHIPGASNLIKKVNNGLTQFKNTRDINILSNLKGTLFEFRLLNKLDNVVGVGLNALDIGLKSGLTKEASAGLLKRFGDVTFDFVQKSSNGLINLVEAKTSKVFGTATSFKGLGREGKDILKKLDFFSEFTKNGGRGTLELITTESMSKELRSDITRIAAEKGIDTKLLKFTIE